jgi:hypothetical protein
VARRGGSISALLFDGAEALVELFDGFDDGCDEALGQWPPAILEPTGKARDVAV